MSTKICGYCGRENEDGAPACRECGTRLGSATDEVNSQGDDLGAPAPPRGLKVGITLAAFWLAVLAMIPLSPAVVVSPSWVWRFPSGLWGLFKGSDVANALTGWIFYAALMSGLMLARRRIWFVLFYATLCIVLATNVAGCYRIFIENLRGIN